MVEAVDQEQRLESGFQYPGCSTKSENREPGAGTSEHRLVVVERYEAGLMDGATARAVVLLASPAENAGKAGGWPSTERDLFAQMNDGGRTVESQSKAEKSSG